MSKVKVRCVKCPNCKDLIFSRANHDLHYCTCGDTYVDGGFDYLRVGGKDINNIKTINKFIMNTTKKELYADWNNNINKYGIIKEK